MRDTLLSDFVADVDRFPVDITMMSPWQIVAQLQCLVLKRWTGCRPSFITDQGK